MGGQEQEQVNTRSGTQTKLTARSRQPIPNNATTITHHGGALDQSTTLTPRKGSKCKSKSTKDKDQDQTPRNVKNQQLLINFHPPSPPQINSKMKLIIFCVYLCMASVQRQEHEPSFLCGSYVEMATTKHAKPAASDKDISFTIITLAIYLPPTQHVQPPISSW